MKHLWSWLAPKHPSSFFILEKRLGPRFQFICLFQSYCWLLLMQSVDVDFSFPRKYLILLDLETKGACVIINFWAHPVLNVLPSFIPGKDTLKYPGRADVLVYLGCHDKILQTGGVNNRNLFNSVYSQFQTLEVRDQNASDFIFG